MWLALKFLQRSLTRADQPSDPRAIVDGQTPLEENRKPRDKAVGDVEGLNEEGCKVPFWYTQNCDQLEHLCRIAKNDKRVFWIEREQPPRTVAQYT